VLVNHAAATSSNPRHLLRSATGSARYAKPGNTYHE
jgi:hypothetical protein